VSVLTAQGPDPAVDIVSVYKVKWLRPLRATYGEIEVDGSPSSASSLTWMHAAYFNKQCPGMACDPVEWSRSGRRASRSWEHAW
jgi:hypothetical protein